MGLQLIFGYPGFIQLQGRHSTRAEHGVPHEERVRLCDLDGTWHTMDTIFTSMRDEQGGLAIVVNSRDVTQRLDAERALSESEELEVIDRRCSVIFVELLGYFHLPVIELTEARWADQAEDVGLLGVQQHGDGLFRPWLDAQQFALKVPEYNATAARTMSETEFLKLFQRVDFREAKPDPMTRLIAGITGEHHAPEF